MAKMKRISGPWKIRTAMGRPDEDGAAVDPALPAFHYIETQAGDVVAATWPGPNIECARLIAAAPDLLAALELAANTIRANLTYCGYRPGECTDGWAPTIRAQVAALAKIDAAIAKARGEV